MNNKEHHVVFNKNNFHSKSAVLTAKFTGNKWSFRSDCSFDPKIAAGQYRDQTSRTLVQASELGMASHSARSDPTGGRNITQLFSQQEAQLSQRGRAMLRVCL